MLLGDKEPSMATLAPATPAVTSAYRADHVGCFLRAPEILQARQNHMAAQQLRALERFASVVFLHHERQNLLHALVGSEPTRALLALATAPRDVPHGGES